LTANFNNESSKVSFISFSPSVIVALSEIIAFDKAIGRMILPKKTVKGTMTNVKKVQKINERERENDGYFIAFVCFNVIYLCL
jgi:hypothetical protein